jgi:hypothetical protein
MYAIGDSTVSAVVFLSSQRKYAGQDRSYLSLTFFVFFVYFTIII